jgi:argonaute-like protein implicated in RNA metabolism and viral defense
MEASEQEFIPIVSGLPRSGTSMMMKMLLAGGMEVLTDNLRTADEDNPEGFFEFEKVKQLEKDSVWLEDSAGKAVKIVSAFLKHLPQKYNYRIIFMRRKIEEVLASQKQMLIRRGEPTDRVSDEKMSEIFQRHLQDIESWLAAQPNIRVLYVNYNDAIENPGPSIRLVNDFLRADLDVEAMAAVVNRNLYRQRL